MSTVTKIIDTIGTETLSKELGIGASAFSNAKKAQQMPSSWYVTIKRLSGDKGIDCPMELFAWKHAASPTGEVA